MSVPVTPPGHSPPAEIVNGTHHGAWIIIATAMALTLVLVCILIRFFVKVTLRPLSGLADIYLSCATITAVAQSATVFYAAGKGLGNSIELISPTALNYIQKSVYAGDFFYLVTLYLSKCCVGCMYLRITPKRSHNLASWGVISLSSFWLVAAIFMISVKCELEQPWVGIANHCTNMFLRWQLITAFDIITEAILFLLSIYVVFGLQMGLKRKAIVVLTFGARLPIIAFAVLRLYYLNTLIHSLNPTLTSVYAVIWTEIEMHFSIIACTSYCLQPFIQAVSTHYGSAAIDVDGFEATKGTAVSAVASGSRSKQHSFQGKRSGILSSGDSFGLQSIHRLSNPTRALTRINEEQERKTSSKWFRPDPVCSRTTVMGQPGHDTDSLRSNNSTKMIIRKQIDYEVEYSEGLGKDDRGSDSSMTQRHV